MLPSCVFMFFYFDAQLDIAFMTSRCVQLSFGGMKGSERSSVLNKERWKEGKKVLPLGQKMKSQTLV